MISQKRPSNKLIVLLVLILIIGLFISYKNRLFDYNLPILVSTNERKFVFFDLGVNNGDSLLNFFEMTSQG